MSSMRHWSMDESVGSLYEPGRQGHAHGPAGPFYGIGPAWADHKTSWAVPPEDVPKDETDMFY